MLNKGTCIFPVGKKQACGATVMLSDDKGRQMMFCAKHQREVLDRMAKWKPGQNKGKPNYIVPRGYKLPE